MAILIEPLVPIFCDDIRTETSGKLLLIGTYTGPVVVESFPASLTLRCVVISSVSGEGRSEISFVVNVFDLESDEPVNSIATKIAIESLPDAAGTGARVFLQLPEFTADVDGPTSISIAVDRNEDGLELVGGIEVWDSGQV
ncbi:MAG: hypothetical protein AAF498_09195 [Pseudomonadota bacterium]